MGGTRIPIRALVLKFKEQRCGMTQNKLSQPGTGRKRRRRRTWESPH
jgi:hypothetical protein